MELSLIHIFKCGMSEFNILGTDPEEFPELPTVEYQNSLILPQSRLKAMISQTLFAVSDNESRPIHTGSLFEVDSEGLTIVSVDGYRLAPVSYTHLVPLPGQLQLVQRPGQEQPLPVVPGQLIQQFRFIHTYFLACGKRAPRRAPFPFVITVSAKRRSL